MIKCNFLTYDQSHSIYNIFNQQLSNHNFCFFVINASSSQIFFIPNSFIFKNNDNMTQQLIDNLLLNNQWQVKVQLIKQLQKFPPHEIIFRIFQNRSSNLSEYQFCHSGIPGTILTMLMDLRSKLSLTTMQFLVWLFTQCIHLKSSDIKLQSNFQMNLFEKNYQSPHNYQQTVIPDMFINNLLSQHYLLKLLNSSHKLIANGADQVIKTMIISIHEGQWKFVDHFKQTFLQTKNVYVRERLSMYFLIISQQNIQGPRSFYIDAKQFYSKTQKDKSITVRKNFEQLKNYLDRDPEFNKSGIETKRPSTRKPLKSIQSKLNTKQSETTRKKKTVIAKFVQQKGHKNKSIQKHTTSVIVDNFLKPVNINTERTPISQDTQINNSFLISLRDKIKNRNEKWTDKIIFIEQFFKKAELFLLTRNQEYESFEIIMEMLICLFTQKRNKLFATAASFLLQIINEANNQEQETSKKKSFLKNYFKKQPLLTNFFYQLMELNRDSIIYQIHFSMVKMLGKRYLDIVISNSTKVRTKKQLILILDLLAQSFHYPVNLALYENEIQMAKVLSIMTKFITNFSKRDKSIILPALTIFSQFKAYHPSFVLKWIIAQQNYIIQKIVQIARQINPSLQNAIIEYIAHSNQLNFSKNSQKNKNSQNNKKESQSKMFFADILLILRDLIEKIAKNQENGVNQLAKFMFTFEDINMLSSHEQTKIYEQLIVSIQYVTSKQSLLELMIFFYEFAKMPRPNFLASIVNVLRKNYLKKDQFVGIPEQKSVYVLHYLKIILYYLEAGNQIDNNCCQCICNLFRTQQDLEIRKAAMQLLRKIQNLCLQQDKAIKMEQFLMERQMCLLRTFNEENEGFFERNR